MALTRERLRHELRDLVEVVLVPAIAAVLPWPIAFAIFKQLAKWDWIYREPSRRALAEAQKRGWATQPHDWLHSRKLTTIVDHADHYLARTRSDGWLDKYLEVQGQWPPAGQAAIALTFHWGAGMWGLRSACQAGMKGHMLVAALDSAHFAGRSILHRYIKARTRSISLSLKCPFIDVSTDMRAAIRALRNDEQLLAVVDVPADQVAVSQPVEVLGMAARLPTALLRLAVERKIPVCMYITGIDMGSGKRFLRIRQLGVPADLDALVAEAAGELDHLIRENPPAWHFWSEAERFFRP